MFECFFQSGGTLLHKCVDKPRVYTYILANHGVEVNIQDVVSLYLNHLNTQNYRNKDSFF